MSVAGATAQSPGAVVTSKAKTDDTIVLHRRTIDAILTGTGALLVAVLVVAGLLLLWGQRFSNDYVHKELSSQNITFPSAESLKGENPPRTDLVKYAGQHVTSGKQAEAYASLIKGHLEHAAPGKTYATIGADETAAKKAVTDAKASGADAATIADLQAKADTVSNTRNTLFKGETLRGLLLTAFAWSTLGRIAGIAAWVAFAAAVVMIVLVALGYWHRRKTVQALSS